MSGEYSRVSTNDEDEGVAASPASANGKPLLKKDKGVKKPFSEQVKEDFWSNVSFVCCGGYKRELRELQRERAAFSGVVRRRQPLSCEMCAAARAWTHSMRHSAADSRPWDLQRERQPTTPRSSTDSSDR